MGADADPPTRLSKRNFRPAQLEIDDAATIAVDRAQRRYLVPGDAPRHQAPIPNPVPVDREYGRLGCGPPAEAVHEHGNAEEPRQAEPSHGRDRALHSDRRRHRDAEKDE
jgi:hypothetical protein